MLLILYFSKFNEPINMYFTNVYPYASKWIGLNMLAVNSNTVIMDPAQTDLINTLEKHKFNIITHTLRHSRTLGGGHHCVTLDTWRENA